MKKIQNSMSAQVFANPTSEQIEYSYSKTNTPLQTLSSYSEWKDQNINISDTFNNPKFTSLNQQLVGDANPRTKIAPIIISPIFDTENWRPTDFIVPSGINDQKTRELFQSGYATRLENCSTLKQIPPICDTTAISFQCKGNPPIGGV